MKRLSLLLPALLLALFTCNAGFCANHDNVWKQYLSASEQAALLKIASPPPEASQPQTKPDPEQMLAILRTGFNHFGETLAKPLTTQPAAFAEGNIKGLWFKPAKADQSKVLLYFHGGGYVLGSPRTAAGITDFLAVSAGITCFSLDYPLAPEHPYPAAIENALLAYKMLLAKGFKPGHITLAGDSAGGGLALALLLKLREEKLPMPAGAYLLSPWTDLSASLPSHTLKRDDDALVALEFVQNLANWYAGKQDLTAPLISPAFADLRGLPPLFIQVGSFEVLLDDALTIARNAGLADVPVRLSIWPGYYHVFQMMHKELQGGRRALRDGAVFLNEAMNQKLLIPAGN